VRDVCSLPAVALTVILAFFLAASGCQRGCSEEDLGTIVHGVPDVPGSEKVFPLPELDPTAQSEDSSELILIPVPPGHELPRE